MSPCEEYKKLVEEWHAARGNERLQRLQNPEIAETFRAQAERLKHAMEEHVLVCMACKNS